jgi:heterotetrameric sarcosine oxidase gamma subunit
MTATGQGCMAEVSFVTVERCTRVALRASPDSAALIGAALGITLGHDPCRATVAGDRAALWLGPDEWLLLAPDGEAPRLTAAATQALGDLRASIVDVSHRTIAIEVCGARAANTLNAFCALDLDPRAFPVGMCTRTVFGKAEIVLWRTAPETFRIEVARSFAPYLLDCLSEGAREFLNQREAG